MLIALIHTSVLICVQYHSVSHVQYITSNFDSVDFAKNFFSRLHLFCLNILWSIINIYTK